MKNKIPNRLEGIFYCTVVAGIGIALVVRGLYDDYFRDHSGYEHKVNRTIPIKSVQEGYGILEDGREIQIQERDGKLSILEKSLEKLK